MLQQMRSAAKYVWVFIALAFVGGFVFYETLRPLQQQRPHHVHRGRASVNGRTSSTRRGRTRARTRCASRSSGPATA